MLSEISQGEIVGEIVVISAVVSPPAISVSRLAGLTGQHIRSVSSPVIVPDFYLPDKYRKKLGCNQQFIPQYREIYLWFCKVLGL